MLQIIRKQLRAQGTDLLWGPVIMTAVAVFGMILMYFIIKFSGENEMWFPIGTMLGMIVAAVYIFIWISVGVGLYFNLEAAMGCTRKDFFLSYYMTGFLVSIVYVILLTVICMAENSIGKILYPDMINEIDLLPCMIRWGIPAAVALTVIGGFCGTLVLRFGKKAFWVMWAIWMIVCLGGPRAAEAVSESPDSLFGKMGLAIEMLVERVPLNLWILLAIVIVLACGIGNYLMLRRQQVSL